MARWSVLWALWVKWRASWSCAQWRWQCQGGCLMARPLAGRLLRPTCRWHSRLHRCLAIATAIAIATEPRARLSSRTVHTASTNVIFRSHLSSIRLLTRGIRELGLLNDTLFINLQSYTGNVIGDLYTVGSGHIFPTRNGGDLPTYRHHHTLSLTEMANVGVRYFNNIPSDVEVYEGKNFANVLKEFLIKK